MTEMDPRAVLLRATPESTWLAQVRELARLRGFLTYHTLRSRGSEHGFPDVIAVHPDRGLVLALELKRVGKLPTAMQRRWLEALDGRVVQSYCLTPADMSLTKLLLGVDG